MKSTCTLIYICQPVNAFKEITAIENWLRMNKTILNMFLSTENEAHARGMGIKYNTMGTLQVCFSATTIEVG